MKITPLYFGNMSGKMGATVASHNRYGTYLRQHAIPVNPSTQRQNTARSIFAAMVNRWNSAGMATKKAGWELYAANVQVKDRNGNPQTLTGLSMYIRCATVVYQARQDYPSTAPSVMSLPEVDPSAAVSISAATQKVSVSFSKLLPWALEDGGDMVVQMGQPQGSGVNFFIGPWRYAGTIAGHTAGAPDSPALIDVPFPVAADEKVWVRLRIVRADSRVSEPFLCQCVVGE